MKAYSLNLREKVVKADEKGNTSIRQVEARFDVSKAFVQKLLQQKQISGNIQPNTR
jgi:transposase